jgi:tetratricopeptide (TPR) repeat protein
MRAAGGRSGEHDQIGHYRILERIGTGGMGEVYRAEQTEPIRRTVALKIIKLGMDTKEVITRFEAERQALALMDHTNIAKVYDAGSTPRGRPYFVMEHVRGVPITTYCDTQKLSTRDRLQLFIRLCEGVQHAHQKAIIHRDLKPSNVLVTIQDGKPVPKIIDFGVAKATAQKLTEKTMYTSVGELIGTPEYMSPEQAEMTGADVDTQTDVYSLGVILYELLAGALPFDPKELRKAGFAGIVRTIRNQDPQRPSTKVGSLGERGAEAARARRTVPKKLVGRLRGDLDWITMRALEKDRTRRYASPADLAADVRRHLRHEPVTAGPPGAGYRAKKFARRYRVWVVAGSVVTVSLVAAAVVSVLFALSEAQQRRLAAAERDRANAEAKAAREVTEFLVSSFEVADPREPRDEEVTAGQILERGAAKIDHELRDQPLLRAQMMDAIGRVYQNLGRYDRAEEMLEGALELRRAELGERHADVARSMSTLGWLRNNQEMLHEGQELEREALSIQQELLGQNHVDTAWSFYYLGALEVRSADYGCAHEHLERARAVFESQLPPHALAVSWCWQDLGNIYWYTGDHAKQLECHRRALEIKERILPRDHVDVAISLTGVGAGLGRGMSDWNAAVPYFERAMEIYKKTLGPAHDLTANAMFFLGSALRETGRFDEARTYQERSLNIYRRVSGEESYMVGSVLGELAPLAHVAGRIREAESLYARALPMLENHFGSGKGDVEFASFIARYAAVMRDLNQDAKAESLEARASALREMLEREKSASWKPCDFTLAGRDAPPSQALPQRE